MKILVPYMSATESTLEEDVAANVVPGGIEKFTQTLYKTIPGVIPVTITKSDRKSRATKKKIIAALDAESPDLIIMNDPWKAVHCINYGVPMILIIHEPLDRDIRMVALGQILKDINDAGHHIYFVSPTQLDYHRKMAMRISQTDFGEIAGFVNPAFCDIDLEPSRDVDWDCATVGRICTLKNPFLLHAVAGKSDLKTLVVTSSVDVKSKAVNNYALKHSKWEAPRETHIDLPHKDVLDRISRSASFMSTCPSESWGISALEAFALGAHPLLVTHEKLSGHSSAAIAASPDHYTTIPRKAKPEEVVEIIRAKSKFSYDARMEMSEMTKEKHSLNKWKGSIETMLQKRLDASKSDNSGLMQFY